MGCREALVLARRRHRVGMRPGGDHHTLHMGAEFRQGSLRDCFGTSSEIKAPKTKESWTVFWKPCIGFRSWIKIWLSSQILGGFPSVFHS